jgi:hypothetical protein
MTARRDPERLIRAYLDDGVNELPERSYDAVRAEIDHTRQRAVFGPWREPDMSKFAPFAIAAAAVLVVAAVVGINLAPRQGQVGGPGPNPTVPPSPPPSPVALPFREMSLEPGTYSALFEGYRYTFSVPTADWVSNVEPGGAWTVLSEVEQEPHLIGLFGFGIETDLATDACQWQTTASVPGPTVDDFATALAAMNGFDTSGPTDVTVDGYQGKRVVMTVPEDVNLDACDDGEYHGVGGRYTHNPGTVDDVRVLDLDGTRHVFITTYATGTTAETLAQLDQIVASLQIDPVGD